MKSPAAAGPAVVVVAAFSEAATKIRPDPERSIAIPVGCAPVVVPKPANPAGLDVPSIAATNSGWSPLLGRLALPQMGGSQ